MTWLTNVMEQSDVNRSGTNVTQDNNGGLTWAWAGRGLSKNFTVRKHIGVKLSYIRERIWNKEMKLKKVNTERILASFLTMPFAQKDFKTAVACARVIFHSNICDVSDVRRAIEASTSTDGLSCWYVSVHGRDKRTIMIERCPHDTKDELLTSRFNQWNMLVKQSGSAKC